MQIRRYYSGPSKYRISPDPVIIKYSPVFCSSEYCKYLPRNNPITGDPKTTIECHAPYGTVSLCRFGIEHVTFGTIQSSGLRVASLDRRKLNNKAMLLFNKDVITYSLLYSHGNLLSAATRLTVLLLHLLLSFGLLTRLKGYHSWATRLINPNPWTQLKHSSN